MLCAASAAFLLWAAPAQADSVKAGCTTPSCEREKDYWDSKYRALPEADKRWLWSTGECETRGLRRPYRANTGNGYWGRYQFSPPTAGSAGFKIKAYRAYKREQDVRAIRWKRIAGAGQWPVCG